MKGCFELHFSGQPLLAPPPKNQTNEMLNMKMKTTILLAASLALTLGANAATVIASNTTFDGANVQEWNNANYNSTSHVVQNYSGDWGTPYNLAQSFSTGTLGTDNLLSEISLGTVGDVSASTVTAYLYAATTGDSSGNYLAVGASPVATATINLSAVTGPTTVTFDFSSANLTLSDNTTYAFYLSSAISSFAWAGNSTSSYAGGEAAGVFMSNLGAGQPGFWLGNGDTAGDSTRNVAGDRVFSVTAIPEPSAALLGGLGMLALLRRRRA
jgi:hypothetical protein